jgi:hypothetical protein
MKTVEINVWKFQIRNTYGILDGTPHKKRPAGRLRLRQKRNVNVCMLRKYIKMSCALALPHVKYIHLH